MKKLVAGMKLYCVAYFHFSKGTERRLQSTTIKRINPTTVTTEWYDAHRIKLTDIGKEVFLSKKEAYARALKKHQIVYEQEKNNRNFNKKVFENEIVYLKRKIREEDRR